jgi:hypothetical protein
MQVRIHGSSGSNVGYICCMRDGIPRRRFPSFVSTRMICAAVRFNFPDDAAELVLRVGRARGWHGLQQATGRSIAKVRPLSPP